MPRSPESSRTGPARSRVRAFGSFGVLWIVAWGLLTAGVPAAHADPDAGSRQQCAATTPQQARRLAEALFEQGAYERAGECYEAAGQYALANRAFVKAVGPQSESASHQLSVQSDQAQDLLHRVQKAFRTHH